MPRFAANISMMFPEYDIKDRFKAAADAGFQAIEILQPYSLTTDELNRGLEDNDLQWILMNTPMGDAARGDRGLAAIPGRQDAFNRCFDQALMYAKACHVPMIHFMAGVVPDDTDESTCLRTFEENLANAADVAGESGIQLLSEPLNGQDVPGYLIQGTARARDIISSVNRANVRLQYDFYHLQIMQGNLAAGLKECWDVIGHIQFSSLPGRHEPQYGEVNMPHLFGVLDELGYTGWVGCEYRPKEDTWNGLSWGAFYGLGLNS